MGEFVTLSLDLGLTFGWAVGKSDGQNGIIESSGELALAINHAHPGHRWLKWQEWLYQYRNVNEILYEDVTGFRSGDAAKSYGAMLSHLHVFCLVHGIRTGSLTPMQVKEDFTGLKMAKKEQMCDVAMNLGWKKGTRDTRELNNECDAIALLWVVYTRRLVRPAFLL